MTAVGVAKAWRLRQSHRVELDAASIAPVRESSAMSKTVLITGGSRGIGRATCLLAAERGWSVGVNYLKDSAAAH